MERERERLSECKGLLSSQQGVSGVNRSWRVNASREQGWEIHTPLSHVGMSHYMESHAEQTVVASITKNAFDKNAATDG
jgi:hypothetical protein